MAPKKLCTYCDELATTKDHVPPKCFFTEKKPPNLITVPSCNACNKFFGDEIDTHARNSIAAIHRSETHWSVSQELGGKRDRSFERKVINLEYIVSVVSLKEVVTPAGIYLGVAPTINLNNTVMNNFFERLARGLIRKVVGVRSFGVKFQWGLLDGLLATIGGPEALRRNFGFPMEWRDFGDGTFVYVGWIEKERPESLWIVQFYGGDQFYLLVTRA